MNAAVVEEEADRIQRVFDAARRIARRVLDDGSQEPFIPDEWIDSVIAIATVLGGTDPDEKQVAWAVRTMLRAGVEAWARERFRRRARSEAAREAAARRKAGRTIAEMRPR